MKKYFILLIPLILLCINFRSYSQDIIVEKFSKIPKYVDGCGCFFYLKKSDENKNYYIFVSSGGNAAMKIDGSIQRLKEITEDYSNGYYGEFSNNYYEVIIKGKKTGKGYESTNYKGKITVRNKQTAAEITINFIGDCGC